MKRAGGAEVLHGLRFLPAQINCMAFDWTALFFSMMPGTGSGTRLSLRSSIHVTREILTGHTDTFSRYCTWVWYYLRVRGI